MMEHVLEDIFRHEITYFDSGQSYHTYLYGSVNRTTNSIFYEFDSRIDQSGQ